MQYLAHIVPAAHYFGALFVFYSRAPATPREQISLVNMKLWAIHGNPNIVSLPAPIHSCPD
jgi:hypothetical protein